MTKISKHQRDARSSAIFVFLAVLCLVIAGLVNGCASKSRPYESTKTTTIAVDGSQVITETVKRDSKIRASGYKMDLAGFSVDEQFQEGGDSTYKLNSEGAKATPQSQALEAFTGGLNAALKIQGFAPNAEASLPKELQDRLTKLEESLSDLDRIAKALEATRPAGAVE